MVCWNRVELKTLLTLPIRNGYSPICADQPSGKWILGLGALSENGLDTSQKKPAPNNDTKVDEYTLHKGDFLVSRSNTIDKVGRSTLYRGEIEDCSYPDLMMRFRIDEVKIVPEFLEHFLRSKEAVRYFQKCASGTSESMVKINKSILEDLKVPLPPRDQQHLIADLLTVWDKAIRESELLSDAKNRRHKALSRMMLDTNCREQGLRKFLRPVLREAKKPSQAYWALGIRSHGKGTFRRWIEDPSMVAMETLYQVRCNDLIVNITFAWEGAIALVNKTDEDCLVSHRFPTYEIDTKKVIPDYLRHIVVQKRFVHNLGIISPGGAGRNRVLNKQDFLDLNVALPSLEEQQRIANTLNTSLAEIVLLRRKLAALQKQKRGLMQKLLTGEWRMKVRNQDGK